jgi:hypothetical protein
MEAGATVDAEKVIERRVPGDQDDHMRDVVERANSG